MSSDARHGSSATPPPAPPTSAPDRRTARLEAMVRAQHMLAASAATDEQLRAEVAELAARVLDADGAVFELIEGEDVVYRAATGIASGQTGRRLPLSASLSGLAWREQRVQLARDACDDARVDQAQCRDLGIGSMAVAPIPLRAGRYAGLLKVVAHRPDHFDQDDAEALGLLAAAVGAALQRRQDSRDQLRLAAAQARLIAMQQQMSHSEAELDLLMTQALDDACELTAADEALWLDAEGQPLAHSTRSMPDPALAATARGGSQLAVPLPVAGEARGRLLVRAARAGGFDAQDAHHLRLLAASLGVSLERREQAARLQRSERQYRMLFDANPHPMWVYDLQTLRFLAVNDAAVEQYGWPRAEFLGLTLRDIRPPSEYAAMERALAELPPDGAFRSMRRHQRRNGEPIDVEVTSDPIEFAGRRARLVMAHDVTARVRTEAERASAERALRILSACNGAMVRVGDEVRLLEEICRIVVEIGGYRLAGVGYAEHDQEKTLRPVAAAGMHAAHVHRMQLSWSAESLWGRGPAGECVRTGQVMIDADLADDSHPSAWHDAALTMGFRSAIALPLKDESGCFGFLGLYSDEAQAPQAREVALLTELADNLSFGIAALRAERERSAAERKLLFHATHDATTGLPRYAVQEPRIEALLGDPETLTAVMIVDVDRFNAVNESLGHRTADQVLRRVAERVAQFAGAQVVVAHFAADELLVALSAGTEEAALALAERIRAVIAAPIEADGYRVVLSATIGMSFGPTHGRTPLELTRAAQVAMERGKELGRDQVACFGREQLHEIEDRVTLGSRLRLAAERGELCLHFQPQLSAAERELTGFEALLRWTNPELGSISPARFIPLAEALGLMPEIGAWVIRAACRQVREWLDRGHADFVVSVNVSAQQLQRAGLAGTVAAALAEYGVPPALLDLELTESSLMENLGRVKDTLAELKRLGVRLSLDDFGTGYSSLAYLKTFALDKLKIDQSFVRGLPENRDDAAIARMIVSIGHQLRLAVAAEGVETAAQADFLRDIGCDELQGYHFGRPAPAPEAEARLAARAD